MYFSSRDSVTNSEPNAAMVSHIQRLLSATIELRLDCFATTDKHQLYGQTSVSPDKQHGNTSVSPHGQLPSLTLQSLHSIQSSAPPSTNLFRGGNFHKRSCNLKQHFFQRGYDEQHLNTELRRALNTTRETCLQIKRNQEKSARIPLVVIYHPSLPSLHLTTKRHLPILHASDRIRETFRHPPLIAFGRQRNLRYFLV